MKKEQAEQQKVADASLAALNAAQAAAALKVKERRAVEAAAQAGGERFAAEAAITKAEAEAAEAAEVLAARDRQCGQAAAEADRIESERKAAEEDAAAALQKADENHAIQKVKLVSKTVFD